MLSPEEGAALARALDAAAAATVGPRGGAEALERLMPLVSSLFGAAACSVAILEDDLVRFVAAHGGAGAALVGQSIPVGRGIAGWAVLSGTAVGVSDVQADPRFARDFAESMGYVPREILAAPVRAEGAVIGVIEVLDPRRGSDDRGRDLEVLETLGTFAGAAWASAEASAAPVRAFLRTVADDDPEAAEAVAVDEGLARVAADLRVLAAAPGGVELTHDVLGAITEFLARRNKG
jgi:GAF domain-containing protein